MKSFFTSFKVWAFVNILICISAEKSIAQDNYTSQNSVSAIDPSSLSAKTGFQSVTLKWNSVSFPDAKAKRAGYLVIYSTSTPSLLNSPNGNKPDNAVLNGIIVPTVDASLPDQPFATAIATGLTNGTAYNFMVVAYLWDGLNKSSYIYSAPAVFCVTIPPSSPDSIDVPVSGLTSNSIAGSFNLPVILPEGYVVSYSTNEKGPLLIDGVEYHPGQVFLGDTILQVGSSSFFSIASSLSPNTTYYIHVYSYVLSGCKNETVYSSTYLSGRVTTLAEEKPDNFADVIDVEPNPAVSNAWLKISSRKNDQISISIFAADGKRAANKITQVQEGINRISLNTERFRPGMYALLVIFSNGETKVIQFMKK